MTQELGAIVRLKTANRRTELCMSIGNKANNMIVNFGFMTKRKRLAVMCIIIN